MQESDVRDEMTLGRWVLRYLIGRPGSLARQMSFYTIAVLGFFPFVAIFAALRHKPNVAYPIAIAGFLFVLWLSWWLLNRIFARLNRKYGEFPEVES
jgi:Flp pilus assembly protein TadB